VWEISPLIDDSKMSSNGRLKQVGISYKLVDSSLLDSMWFYKSMSTIHRHDAV